MKKIYEKLAKCKTEIKQTKLKKEGRNDYSGYDYFTPNQIEILVATACDNNKLITFFDLNRNEFGVYGVLSVVDLDTGEKVQFTMATDVPVIKATNIAQQLGGCVTYTERYLKTSVFGIVDNSLDFDSNESKKKIDDEQKKAEKIEAERQSKLLKEIELSKAILDKCKSLETLKIAYTALSEHMQKCTAKHCTELKEKLTVKK